MVWACQQKLRVRREMSPNDLGPTCLLSQAEYFRVGSRSFRDHLHQTNGKKKLKGSLALMEGRALKPASAGADTSTKVTAVDTTIILSFPG